METLNTYEYYYDFLESAKEDENIMYWMIKEGLADESDFEYEVKKEI